MSEPRRHLIRICEITEVGLLITSALLLAITRFPGVICFNLFWQSALISRRLEQFCIKILHLPKETRITNTTLKSY